MTYVDGFVFTVPKKNHKAYVKMAKLGKKTWLKHGALDYKECKGDDLKAPMRKTFPQITKASKNEDVWFSFIVFKSKAHRNAVNKKVMKEFSNMSGPTDMPFDMNKLAYGGFKTVVEGKR
ncbi:MAG TPA: DUF1428 domain-containing protein [Acidobacteriota bacterium]|nr:DUF1428 domain-containing protein [Acidobacteriota bacterium]